MAYTDLQSAYLFHRRNRGARALRAYELAKADIDAKARRYPRGNRYSVCNREIAQERAHGWRHCRWIEDCAAIGLREVGFADEILSLRHNGWFADAFQDEIYRGQVWQIPARHGRPQFVYGYADPCNEGAALICFDVEEDKSEAARGADSLAESFAEAEREYSEAWQAARQWEELGDEMKAARGKARALVAEMRKAIREGKQAGAAICEALRGKLADYAAQWESARNEREEMADNFHYWQDGKSISIADFAKANL